MSRAEFHMINQCNRKVVVNRTITFSILIFLLVILPGCSGVALKPWHTEKLTEEFTEKQSEEVRSFADYQALEDRLFRQLDEKVYAKSETGTEYKLDRYSAGSAADLRKQQPDWNRSFELTADRPRGAILLLHGMSDSPYSLRSLGEALNRHDYWILGMRLPGHGTAPSGLRYISRHDMAAAVRLGMSHLGEKMNGKPVHIIGYSTGAPLALEFTLDALEGKRTLVPASLVLISPAIGVHSSAAMAGFKDSLGNLPGLGGLAFLRVEHEFDPYKYNSFASNAADVVHRLTRTVAGRIRTRASTDPEIVLPPVLVFKSTVDATVTTDAVVSDLLNRLKPDRHELVLFDINRHAAVKSRLIIDDPAPLTDRLMKDARLPFTLTVVTNEHEETTRVISKEKKPFSADTEDFRNLDLSWPTGVISLSHVALPFPPDDPMYGQRAPENDNFLFLGQMAIQGERGLLQIPADWLLRLRYNPFYDFLESHAIQWIDNANGSSVNP